jgi:hypothetical protein
MDPQDCLELSILDKMFEFYLVAQSLNTNLVHMVIFAREGKAILLFLMC